MSYYSSKIKLIISPVLFCSFGTVCAILSLLFKDGSNDQDSKCLHVSLGGVFQVNTGNITKHQGIPVWELFPEQRAWKYSMEKLLCSNWDFQPWVKRPSQNAQKQENVLFCGYHFNNGVRLFGSFHHVGIKIFQRLQITLITKFWKQHLTGLLSRVLLLDIFDVCYFW